MKRYKVHFKNKKDAQYFAYSYTLKDGNYYFHTKEHQSDLEAWALEKEGTVIDDQTATTGGFAPISIG